jgi:hypothetical protein
MDIDLSTLTARYIPCQPLEDGIGFVTLHWLQTCGDGTRVPMRLRTPIVLRHGTVRYEAIQHLSRELLEVVAEAYTQWARGQGGEQE